MREEKMALLDEVWDIILDRLRMPVPSRHRDCPYDVLRDESRPGGIVIITQNHIQLLAAIKETDGDFTIIFSDGQECGIPREDLLGKPN